jgi:hypothetical protein
MIQKYHSIRNTVKNWLIDVNVNGALVVKKGSWRVNWRLWKPRFYIERDGRFPNGVPNYVKEAVRDAWKRVE